MIRRDRLRCSTRRDFLKTGSATAGITGLTALTGCLGGGSSTTTISFLASTATYEGYNEVWQSQVEQYEEDNDIEIEYETSSFGDVIPNVTSAESAGEPYDVIDVGVTSNFWTLQQRGVLEPVTEIVEELGEDHFVDSFLQEFQLDGEYHGLPFRQTGLVKWTRKDRYDEAGYDVPEGTDYQTWDEFVEVTEAIHAPQDELYGNLIALGDNYFNQMYPWSLMHSNGAKILDENGNVAFDSQETIQVMEFLRELQPYNIPNPEGIGTTENWQAFMNQRLGHNFYSTFLLPDEIENNYPGLEGNVDIQPIPARQGTEPACRTTAAVFGISQRSENWDAAKEFTKYLFQPENVLEWHHGVPASSVITIQPLLDEYWDELTSHELYTKYGDMWSKYNDITQEYAASVPLENPGVPQLESTTMISELHIQECIQNILLDDDPIEPSVTSAHQNMVGALEE